MNNYFAYLKLCTYEKNIQAKELAIDTKRNEGYISRILNHKIMNPDIETLMTIEQRLGLKHEDVALENPDFQNLFTQYMDAVYAIDRENRDMLYNKIITFEKIQNTPYMIQLLLAKLTQKTIKKVFDDDFYQMDKKLLYIHKILNNEDKNIFIIFHFGALVLNRKYQQAEHFMVELNNTALNKAELEMMRSYYLFTYHSQAGQTNLCLHYYEECSKCCKAYNHTSRQFNLDIIYANYLMKNNQYKQAIRHNKSLLDISRKSYKYNVGVILNNIAWAYMLLHQYENALKYYLEIDQIKTDMDRHFNIAWCYYKLGDNRNARQWIAEGKELAQNSIYTLLSEWLEAMINKPYSKRCKEALEKASKMCDNTLAEDEKNFVFIQLEDYYYHVGEYEKAHEISHALILQYCPSAA